ncbi:replication initiator protein A [Thermosulfurimonas sp. F29]|uniref:RepB family plasmid replication initiator protein n=1 Tax=Thermosulfurimonas sp. F29 TaxID=2867247 RepID=UPI001C839A35|nr:replication initiator protein A [Thermosulfurimonas sp. F29]MBX6424264.1 replication initiator protein A [Thermosulfurimonas sp. F29]
MKTGETVKSFEKNIKQDINMLEYPLWMQDEKLVSKLENDIGFIWKDREGYEYRCGYKPPTKLDAIFLFYLLYKSQKEGWKEEIELSRYEILKNCGFRSIRPVDYRRLEDSLERWKMVGVRYHGSFYDGKKYITLSFGIIDTWKLEEESKKLYIRFNREWLTRIKNSTYFKYLDFDKIKALRSPLAVRLYEILIKNFQNREEWRIEVTKLAEKIPMKKKYPSHIITKIKTAINRINEHTDLKINLEVEKFKNKTILMFCKGKKRHHDHLLESLIKLLPPSERKKQTLIEAIKRALDRHDEEFVRRNILYANEKVKKPGSYRIFLIKALKEDWAREWWEDNIAQATMFPDMEEVLDEEKRLRIKVEECLKKLSEREIAELRAQALSELPEDLKDEPSLVRMQMRFILRRKLFEEKRT